MDEISDSLHRPQWLPAFPVLLSLVIFGLSLLYALTFSRMVFVSLMEQVIAPDHHPLRYAGPVHHHNPVEWVLLLFPAAGGWVGALASLGYLGRMLGARGKRAD